MRTIEDFCLKGTVESVETYLTTISTKSYRLLGDGGRELLQDFANPNSAGVSWPWLSSSMRFDQQGRLVEDIDGDRPLIEQKPYRYVYTYSPEGRLYQREGYSEDGSIQGTTRFFYRENGGKAAEEYWSPFGWLLFRSEFDQYGNLVRNTFLTADGRVDRAIDFRYEYATSGNIVEQIYTPPEHPTAARGYTFYAPFYTPVDIANGSATPPRYRTVLVHDDDGNLREKLRYWPDGSLHEREVYDTRGVCRESFRTSTGPDNTRKRFDERGRVSEIRQVAPTGLWSSREVNDLTRFEYDEHGNLVEMITTGADGVLIRTTSTKYQFDERGNWIEGTETELNQTWQTDPFAASFETVKKFARRIVYFVSD